MIRNKDSNLQERQLVNWYLWQISRKSIGSKACHRSSCCRREETECPITTTKEV
ncbi:hypothetical protein DPMN_092786 [Dreissena polymorpha]|uniref:Uncharacterized protein n=1 Tax=Dreissena polymorpha TaxID=45954 RepID=A0A9D4L2S8_DREPO|nr:hypothetical protein DPMN_092786 [Dreissena polymorpha]